MEDKKLRPATADEKKMISKAMENWRRINKKIESGYFLEGELQFQMIKEGNL